jgi:signal transduction histidine kinase
MTHHDKSPEYEGLKFFGKMNASISHEIRNTLAVINENAGLIKDLIMMSEKGHPLDLERISGKVEKVLDQVKRSDGIVDNMNRFAHSVDNTCTKINACDYIEFVIRLSERFANMKGLVIKPELPSEPVEIATFPFLFENIIYLCLDLAMQNPGADKIIAIMLHKKDDRIQVEFKGISPEVNAEDSFLSEQSGIFKELGAEIISEKTPDSFILEIKKEPEI